MSAIRRLARRGRSGPRRPGHLAGSRSEPARQGRGRGRSFDSGHGNGPPAHPRKGPVGCFGVMSASSGTVTFLFTDIEGSTPLWQQDEAAMRAALFRHDELLRKTVADHDGMVFSSM